MNLYVRPACLYTKFDLPVQAVVTGWGAINYDVERSETLMKATLEISDRDKCANSYRSFESGSQSDLACGIIDRLMVCAGSTIDPERDTCRVSYK